MEESTRISKICIALSAITVVIVAMFRYKPLGSKRCFMAIENGEVIKQEGNCHTRMPPYCTFNYVLSLIGYDQGILIDEHRPKWPYEQDDMIYLDAWNKDQTPVTWRKSSSVWYSKKLVEKIGIEALEAYLDKMTYGNRDLSGYYHQPSELPWIESTLEISPYEQVWFIHKMLHKQLGISDHAYKMTKRIFYNRSFSTGWDLYGKGGSGHQTGYYRKVGVHSGIFLGWVEKGNRQIIFIATEESQGILGSEYVFKKAKSRALEQLDELLTA